MSNEINIYPNAQKCPWCDRYLMFGQKFAIYDGKDPKYIGWTCHDFCNINPNETDDNLSAKSDESSHLSIYEIEDNNLSEN
jgi:hypothetical protein